MSKSAKVVLVTKGITFNYLKSLSPIWRGRLWHDRLSSKHSINQLAVGQTHRTNLAAHVPANLA